MPSQSMGMGLGGGSDASGLIFSTLVDVTNGGANDLNAVDVTGISSAAKRITVILDNVGYSDNGGSTTDSYFVLQVGDSEGIHTTGYEGQVESLSPITTGFPLIRQIDTAAKITGMIYLINPSDNNWVLTGVTGRTTNSTAASIPVGRKTLSGTLDRIRLTIFDANKRFNSGTIFISVE